MNIDTLKKINPRPSTLEECWEVIDQLIKINIELIERLNSNSDNSSLPPSKDFKKKRR